MERQRHHIYFESELWRQIGLAAKQTGLSKSGFVRQAIREKLARVVRPATRWHDTLAEDRADEEVPTWLRPPT